ncbi:MAG: hypothetical protein K0B14_15230 [Anaerolineaceae bacterium]|nr:hypothetical protein [Anaerolineaceae bacterium]
MLREYAVEPECLKDWQNFRYLIENFGVSQGRLISRFPSSWMRMTYDACNGFTFQQRKKLEYELERIKKSGMIKSQRDYDVAEPWIRNALIQQERGKPFYAILTSSPFPLNCRVLVADQITAENPLWKVSRQDDCPRTPEALGNATEKFLQISDRIIFVDKMFAPLNSRWQKLLVHLIKLATVGRTNPPEFEYHTQFNSKENQSPQDFSDECFRSLSPLLYKDISLKVVRWDRHPDGNFFHARSILSDKGGIDIDWGLDVGKKGQTTRITLMDDDVWERNWNSFQPGSEEFEYIDTVIIHGSRQG